MTLRKQSIVNALLVIGATKRLEEINKEADLLKKIIEKSSTVKTLRLKAAPKKRKKLHWTQQPKNKARVAKWMKHMQAKRRKNANSK